MDKLILRPFHVPTVFRLSIEENVKSPFIQQYQWSVEEAGGQRQFDFTPQRDSVAILLFHRATCRFMVARQFRPAVFVSRVLELPRNKGNPVELIDWEIEDRSLGCTLELCSGHVDDSKKDFDETAISVIEEEFGFQVEPRYLQHIATVLTGVSDSGASCHLYYAELDSAEIISEGKISTRGSARRVWMDIGMAMNVRERQKDPMMMTSHYYALLWWFKHHYVSMKKSLMDDTPLFGIDSRSSREYDTAKFEFEKKNGLVQGKWKCVMEEREGNKPMRMDYMIMGIDKSRDFIYRPDAVSILIEDFDEEEYVITRRFRPAVLAGRVRKLPENRDKQLDQIDFSWYPRSCQYTYEMASGELEEGETADEAVLRVARFDLGYDVPMRELKFIARLLVGSIEGGQSMYVYYAACKTAHRVKNWVEKKGNVERVKLDRYSNEFKSTNTPPSIHIVLTWLVWNRRKYTAEENQMWIEKQERKKKAEAEESKKKEERQKLERLRKVYEREESERKAAEAVAAAAAKEEIEMKKEEEMEEEGTQESEEDMEGDEYGGEADDQLVDDFFQDYFASNLIENRPKARRSRNKTKNGKTIEEDVEWAKPEIETMERMEENDEDYEPDLKRLRNHN